MKKAIVVLLAALLFIVSPGNASASVSTMLNSVNASRAAAGLRPYSYHSDLASVAQRWAQHMAATGILEHNPNLTSQVTGWRYVGENVGYGPDDTAVEAAFMASPHHRSNILDHDFTQIGIGEAYAGGRVWISQVFREPLSTTSTTRTTQPVVKKTYYSRPHATHSPVPTARRNPFVRPTHHVLPVKKLSTAPRHSNYRAYIFPKDWRQYRSGEQAPNL